MSCKKIKRNTDKSFKLAVRYQEIGKYDEAQRIYLEVLKIDSMHAESWFRLGTIWKENNLISEAVKAFCNASQLDDQYHSFLFNFGLTLVSENHVDQAINTLNYLLELQPQVAEIHYSLGLIYFHQKQLSFAEQLLKKAIELKPDYSGAHKDLGRVLIELNRLPEALASFKTAGTIDHRCHEAFRYTGDIYRKQGKYNEAVLAYQAEQAIQPENINGIFDVGLTYLRQQNNVKAIEVFQHIVTQAPLITEARYNLGLAYQNQKEYALAVEAYTSVLEIDADNAAAHNDLGMLYDLLGRPQEAIYHYKEVTRIQPKNMVAKHILAALTGLQLPNGHPDYVTSLFDQYSESFEADLVNNLKYTVPAKLKNAVLDYFDGQAEFDNALDLGCGTGMCGLEFGQFSTKITGVDLSSKMIQMAKAKKIYSTLTQQDIVSFLNTSNELYDLFIAADVFIYVGALESLFEAVQRKSLPHGYFAFSVERCVGDSFWLSTSGRYQHSRNYIQKLADTYFFEIERCDPTGIRLENNTWIPGDLYILRNFAFSKFQQADAMEFDLPYQFSQPFATVM
nr:tetratricopeptide repeat protein [Desulfobulbaceae bacterium]